MTTAPALEPTVNDPLLTRVPLLYDGAFYPYGFPARIRSNSPLALEAAAIGCHPYRKKFDHPPLDVRMLVSESDAPGCVEPPTFRSQGNLLTFVADSENFACLDLSTGFSFGWVTKGTAQNTEYFRQCFLDVMIFCLLEIKHLVTLHAACVMFDGKGLLFAGPSGAGKSSLAYACTRRGWTYVSDDASAFLRDSPRPLVIGHPHRFRFREPVGELFPEFLGLKSSMRAYGKPTIEVGTVSMGGIRTAEDSPIDCIVFLNREAHTGRPQVERVPVEEAWKRLSFSVWAVQLPAYEERIAAVERLLEIPAYEIRYSDLDPAIDALEELTWSSGI
jgi:hypothetical protein